MPLPKIWNDYDRLDAADLNADFAYVLARSGDGGSAFPASPTAGDRFYRTDHHRMYYYDGARWLSDASYGWQIPAISTAYAATTTGSHRSAPPALMGGSDIWLVESVTHFLVSGGTALGASHKWVGLVSKAVGSGGISTVDTVNIDSGASSAWRRIINPLGVLLGATADEIEITWTKTGTPGTLYAFHSFHYRVVAV